VIEELRSRACDERPGDLAFALETNIGSADDPIDPIGFSDVD
jgi:hypothetical protein